MSTDNTKNPGKFISPKKAAKELDKYFKYRARLKKKNNIPWDPKTSHYAYQFGLGQMEEMMKRVSTYNNKNADNPIGGIRVYSSSHDENDDNATDVFLVPYLEKDNKDYTPIDRFDGASEMTLSPEDEEDDGGMILNDTRKCPPFCPPPTD